LSEDTNSKETKHFTRDFGPLLERKQQELVRRKQDQPLETMFHKVQRNTTDLKLAASKCGGLGIILDWNPAIHPEVETVLPRNFPEQANKILAVSTPTDKLHLKGSADNLTKISENDLCLPTLQHDLIIDPYQIYHSRYYGAHYISLFPGTISDNDLLTLFLLSRQHGMAPIMHVSNSKELDKALNTPVQFLCLSETDYFGNKLDIEEIRDIVEEIPQERMVICKLDDWSPEKIEILWDAEINFCWVQYPESTRNLNRLMSIISSYDECKDETDEENGSTQN